MLTEKHLAILGKLREDARVSLAEISRTTGIATSTVFDYYQQLVQKVIIKHTMLPDFKRLGYPLYKKFLVRTKNRSKTHTWLKEQEAVNNLYRVDTHDAFFDAYFADVAELEEFRESLQEELQPQELREIDILEEIRHEAFMPRKV